MNNSRHILNDRDADEAFLRMRASYAAMQKCHDRGPDIDFDHARIEFLKARNAYLTSPRGAEFN